MNQLSKTQEQRRQDILAAEQALLTLPQIEMKPNHYFAKGLYARELFMPKGAAVTGKIHTQEHLVIILYGDVTVATNDGVERYVGPCTFVGKAGSKRALFMHEDTLWTAIHSTSETTVEACEATLATNDYEEFLRIAGEQQCLCG
jgi:5-deoxy-D-glucuronate isomerase